MTKNLRTSVSKKETLYDYIDTIKLEKSAAGEYIKINQEFAMNFRYLLQNYNPQVNEEIVDNNLRYSDKDLKCFIDAANKEHDISSSDTYYAASFSGGVIGFIIGGAFAAVTAPAWQNLAKNYINKDKLGYLLVGEVIVAGGLGSYIGLEVAHSRMEQEEFWHKSLECYNKISLSDLPGVLSEGDIA